MWLHLPCYELLIASYPPGPQPSLGDLEAFGDATGRVYRSPGAKSATVASIRGAFYPARSNGCSMIAFVRIGSEDSPLRSSTSSPRPLDAPAIWSFWENLAV